jgi:hypothetical protein
MRRWLTLCCHCQATKCNTQPTYTRTYVRRPPYRGWDGQALDSACERVQYVRVMGEYGVTQEMLQHRVRDYALAGGYRALAGRPRDLVWYGARAPFCRVVAVPGTDAQLGALVGTSLRTTTRPCH